MKEVATENFQRICEAYEILSDETKRLIYDLYGMEGLTSGLELGPRLSKADEIREELERIKRRNEEAKKMAHFLPSGSIIFNLSMPHFLDGDGLMRGYLRFCSFQDYGYLLVWFLIWVLNLTYEMLTSLEFFYSKWLSRKDMIFFLFSSYVALCIPENFGCLTLRESVIDIYFVSFEVIFFCF